MGSTGNNVCLGLDDDYFGLLGDDDPRPPPLPQGFSIPRKPPVNAAAHFCETQTPGPSDYHAAAAKHIGGGAAVEEHCDVGCVVVGGCVVGAAHYGQHTSGEWSDGAISSLLDNNTELLEHLHGGNFLGHDAKTGHQQQQNDKRLGPLLHRRWKMALLKIGGSVLAGSASENVDPKVAFVVGNRNIYCGDTWAAETGIDRAATCPIRKMASVMNAVLLGASLEKLDIEARVQTALVMHDAIELYTRGRAMHHLEKGRVVILGWIGAETGNPLLTTDTAAALKGF
ncbi:hypothetical protein BAE44_0006551 [Dichanthelium oligosanthes]|uniref:Uncharacterized protein n=1 Tax=Dichanthelium oligosanthes TaxID=888268 RepID=A0A1E5W576_9POAL|nr:hypothetical protein BAE44_0006551 [Dichanthelium oligosanthes]